MGERCCLKVAFLRFVLPAALMPGSVLCLSSPVVFSLRGAAALASSGGVLTSLAESGRLCVGSEKQRTGDPRARQRAQGQAKRRCVAHC